MEDEILAASVAAIVGMLSESASWLRDRATPGCNCASCAATRVAADSLDYLADAYKAGKIAVVSSLAETAKEH